MWGNLRVGIPRNSTGPLGFTIAIRRAERPKNPMGERAPVGFTIENALVKQGRGKGPDGVVKISARGWWEGGGLESGK